MTVSYYIVVAYGEKVIFRDGTIFKPYKPYEEKQNDIELYINRLAKVPEDISEEGAEKLIREKKAYRFNPYKAYEEIKKKILENNKDLSGKELKKKFIAELKELIEKKKSLIDKKAFGKDMERYETAFKMVFEQLKKAKYNEIKNNN